MNSYLPIILTLIGAMVGSGGILFGAIRYNREEAGKIVAQQTNVLSDMRLLNDELIEALTRVKDERDNLQEAVRLLREKLDEETDEVRRLRRKIESLERKIDQLEITIAELNGRLNGDVHD